MRIVGKNLDQVLLNLAFGILGVLLYASGAIPPIAMSVGLYILIFWRFIAGGFHGRVYSFMAAVFCIIPLLHIIGFIVSSDYAFYPTYEISLSDQLNNELRERLALMGLVTMSGLLAGINFGLGDRRALPTATYSNIDDRLNPTLFKTVSLAILSLIIIHIDAPEKTIFTAAYTDSLSIANASGLGSLFPVSFGLNACAWYLYYNLRPSRARKLARFILIASTAIIIIFYQLLRGDREFVGLIVCLFFLADRYTTLHKRSVLIIAFVLIGYILLQSIGLFRSMAVDDFGFFETLGIYFGHGEFFEGTWTAVLLTPLATLGDFYLGGRDYLYGKTYIDYFLSIPPTPVANFLGYLRPITSEQGPAWEVSYGIGGTYVSVVPFLNFSMIGVLAQTFLIGLLVGTIDRKAYRNSHMFVLLSFAVGVVIWGIFWYGEMYLLRALVTTFPLLIVIWYAVGMRIGKAGSVDGNIGL